MNNFLLESTDITIEEIRNHPERLVNLILADDDRSLMLEKRAGTVRITYLKNYDLNTQRIVAEARQAYSAQQADGYSREQAFQDLLQAQEEIAKQLNNTDKL